MNPIVLIPARMAATRLPGQAAGRHRRRADDRARAAPGAGRRRRVRWRWRRAIRRSSRPWSAAGGRAVLTDPDLPSGSDRILAALAELDPRAAARRGDQPAGRHAVRGSRSVLTACAGLLDRRAGLRHRHRGRAGGRRRPTGPIPTSSRRCWRCRPDGRTGAGALLHPLDPLRRAPGLAAHRHLRLPPRGAGAVQRRPALAAGAAREAGAAAGAGARACRSGRR